MAVGTAGIVRRVVWGIALLVIGFNALNGFATIAIQTGAPQQAAAGAIACFEIVVPYVIARAVEGVVVAS